MTQQHTPTPWTFRFRSGGTTIEPMNGTEQLAIVRVTPGVGDMDANARFIVQAVNAHEELLAAAQATLMHIEELEEAWRRGVLTERDNKGGTRSNRNVDCRVQLRAAIAKATSPQAR